MRRLTDTPLHVQPALVGSLLASPARRMLAFAVDAALLVVPSVVTAAAIAGVFLWAGDRPAFDALRRLKAGGLDRAEIHRALRDLAPLLVRLECRGLPAEAVVATEERKLDRAAEILAEYDFQISLNISEGEDEKPLGPRSVRVPVEKLIPPVARGIALFFVPAAYFSLFTCSRLRATPGKLLLGLRVARLDGEHLSLLEGVERFVGYLHIPATLFVSLLDFWRDPNRRLPHDRTVHTAVLRVERQRAATRPVLKGAQ
jgi:hypothetical protein